MARLPFSTVNLELPSMNLIIKRVGRFLISEEGPTAVEYAVMTALILVVCIVVITALGKSISGTFSTVNNSLSSS